MVQRRRPAVTNESVPEREMRDQEVLRANGELAAYFKGRRTEREARAALKIIKAFVKHRERREAKSRPPLPGLDVAKTAKTKMARKPMNAKAAPDAGRRQRKRRRKAHDRLSKDVAVSIKPPVKEEPSPPAV